MKLIRILILLMLLSSFSSKAQSCCDSLKQAKVYGRVLVKDIALKDSLLSVRKQTIEILFKETQRLEQESYKLKESHQALSKQVKLIRKRKNVAVGVSFSLFLILLIK